MILWIHSDWLVYIGLHHVHSSTFILSPSISHDILEFATESACSHDVWDVLHVWCRARPRDGPGEPLPVEVLRFYGFFQETVTERPDENARYRHVSIMFHMEDGTMSMHEPKVLGVGTNNTKSWGGMALKMVNLGDLYRYTSFRIIQCWMIQRRSKESPARLRLPVAMARWKIRASLKAPS